MMSPCSCVEAPHFVGLPRHQRRAHELRELHDRELFRVVAQRGRLVEDARAFALGLLQQVRGVEVFAVEGRVLAHDHASKSFSGRAHVAVSTEPVVLGAGQRDLAHLACTTSPDFQVRCRGSQAAMRWPRRCASRIIEKVVSL
jgi:hypothetical protein